MVLLVNLARVMFAPLLDEFIGVFGVGEATAGLLVTLVWVGSALPRVPTGWLLTRVPRHRVVLATGVVLTAASLFTATAESVVVLGAGALCMGLASGAYFVAANPLISELYPERVGRAMGIHGTASQVAAVVAAPFVALAVVYDWRLAFVAVGVAGAVVTVALTLTARGADLPAAGSADRDLLAAARAQWRVVLTGIVILGLTGFVWQGLFNFYELYMRAKGLSPSAAGTAITVVFAAGVPAFFLSGRLADRFPLVPYILGVVGSFAACLLALTYVEGVAAVLVVTAAVGYVIHSLFPAMDTYLLDTLPDHHRGSAYSVYSFGMMVLQSTGSSAVGALAESGVAYDALFFVFALGLVAVVVVLGGLYRLGRLPS
ncbi:MFS transporter [Halobium salinum]|uniref:MFS transporter n=1 Tax=Halobium salinum TaxID=1364940 RepID=A0ABD5P884_9EURY|nr:MFS transporter [Halobium salinum]